MTNWEKFDKEVDLDALQADIDEASENGFGDFPEVPHGEYEVAVKKIDLVETKKEPKRPMMSIWFEIVDGEFKKQLIFYNQLMDPSSQYSGVQIHSANEMLRSLSDRDKSDVFFKSFGQFAEQAQAIFDEIDGSFEYLLDYGKNDKGYDTYKIKKVYELE